MAINKEPDRCQIQIANKETGGDVAYELVGEGGGHNFQGARTHASEKQPTSRQSHDTMMIKRVNANSPAQAP